MSDFLLYDITVPLSPDLPCWPGDPPMQTQSVLDIHKGDPASVTLLTLGSHAGTHVDAFSHFRENGRSLDDMDLSVYIGRTLVVEIEDPERITLGELQRKPSFLDLRKAERVLFKTENSRLNWYEQPFMERFCHMSPHAADFLVELGVRLVGVDYLSVDAFHAKSLYETDTPCHDRFMDAGVYILEGLALRDVPPGWYEMICLPLKLRGGDGAPARVVLRSPA